MKVLRPVDPWRNQHGELKSDRGIGAAAAFGARTRGFGPRPIASIWRLSNAYVIGEAFYARLLAISTPPANRRGRTTAFLRDREQVAVLESAR